MNESWYTHIQHWYPAEEAAQQVQAERDARVANGESTQEQEQEAADHVRDLQDISNNLENHEWIQGAWRAGGKDGGMTGHKGEQQKVRGGKRGWGGERWSRLETEVHGQWSVSNGSCGSIRVSCTARTHCSTPRHTATHCSTQHTATHCNTLQQNTAVCEE